MLLQANSINKYYQITTERKREVLINLDLSIEKGESIAILGRSGTGKSTLLNILGSLDKPSSGKVFFKGKEINNFSENEENLFRNQSVGFVYQSHHLLPQLSLLENVLLPLLPVKDKNKKAEAEKRAQELLDFVGLKAVLSQKPGELSGGECQRTAVVRALINNPELILADEPTGSLDEENANQITDLLAEINKKYGVSVIMVTHAEQLAGKMSKIYRLREGKLHLLEQK